MTNRTEPAVPAATGTFTFPESIGATYTVGRDAAIEEIRSILRDTRILALDTETYGLGADAMDLKCVQIGTAHRVAVLDPRDPRQREAIRQALHAADELVLHNSAYDVPVLAVNGLLPVSDIRKVTDTLIYARLAEPDEMTSKGLLAAGARYLGAEATDALMPAFKALSMSKSEGYRVFDLDRPLYVRGAAIDVIVTARLLPAVREAAMRTLTDHNYTSAGVTGREAEELREREQRVNRILLRRNARGIRVDLEYLDKYREQTGARSAEIRNELESHGIKPGHGGQLTSWLDSRGLLPAGYPRTAKTGAPSATADSLETIDHPVARSFVELKKTDKIDKDYLQKAADMAALDGRIHPMANILGATTGRMSVNNPPLQQFNGPARGILTAEPGETLTSIDWSQIEPVVAANIAGDTHVLAEYEAATGDLYTTLANMANVNRKQGKLMLLAQMYGQGITRLSESMGISVETAEDIRRALFKAMPETDKLIRKLKAASKHHGCVFTLSGRIVPVPVIRGEVAAYKGVNYFVQGSAYDVLADTLIRIEDAGLDDAVYLAMHDELIVENQAAHDIREIMQTPPERLCWISGRTPVLRTDMLVLGDRWSEA